MHPVLMRAQGVQGTAAILQPIDGVAFWLECGANALGEGNVIFYQQNSHFECSVMAYNRPARLPDDWGLLLPGLGSVR